MLVMLYIFFFYYLSSIKVISAVLQQIGRSLQIQIIKMNNVLLIILAIVFVAILLAINIYLLALYVHTDDKGFGTAFYCKILVVLGLTLCQAQALLVPLDVGNNSSQDPSGIDMKGFWYFIYIVVLIFITLLLPFALFFYETDEDDGYCKRIGTSILYTFLANIVTILVLFITWSVFKYVSLPVATVAAQPYTTPQSSINFNSIVVTNGSTDLELEASFAVYIIALMSFFGWIFVVLFGGVGVFSLPIDMINQFRHRPKARKTQDMMKTKENLVKAITSLLKEGEELKKVDQDNAKNEEGGFFSKWRGNREVDNKLTEFKAKYFALQQQFQVFNLELQFAETNPIVPILKLILGIIFIITSLLWILQIIFGNIAKGTLDRPLIPFMNELLIGLTDRNAGFLATGIYAYLCLFMLWCVQKGTVKFGIRIPCCCRFHPMKENETWMNSFLFNVILMLIASVGVVQLCISSFPSYTHNTEIYMIFGLQIRYLRFYSAFYKNNVFHIAFLAWTFFTLIYLMITCNKKPDYMKEIEKIRKHNVDQD